MKKLLGDRRGANLVEYIVLVGVVALMCIGAFKAFQFRVRAKSVEQSTAVATEITNKLRAGRRPGGRCYRERRHDRGAPCRGP